MKNDVHRCFLAHVTCYRREHVFADQTCIDQLHKFDLLNPSTVIQPPGFATGNSIALLCLKNTDRTLVPSYLEGSLYSRDKFPKQPSSII